MNPDLVLCTLDDGATLGMEFTVASRPRLCAGFGANRPEDAPIGLIPVDAIYSPVRRVSYRVEQTRVGQVTDYDKLILQVETNGAVTPGRRGGAGRADSAGPARHVRQFRGAAAAARRKSRAIELPFNRNLLRKVDELELSVR